MDKFYTPAQIAELLVVDHGKVLDWIASGELPAYNVARHRNGPKARWRISKTDLDDFLVRRRTQGSAAIAKIRRSWQW